MSVLNFPFKVRVVKNLSVRYRLDRGSITEQTPRRLVARRVANAVLFLVQKCSARQLAVIFCGNRVRYETGVFRHGQMKFFDNTDR